MLRFCSSFIGYPVEARNTQFHGVSDSREKYLKTLAEKGPDWEYANLKFSYTRNSYGHRCKEFTELDLSNYILFTGASADEGIGIPAEYRYSDILSSMLNTDSYNLALGGTGNDVIFYNLVSWFTRVKEKPKLVVIHWSDELRYYTVKDERILVTGIWAKEDQEFLLMGEDYFRTRTESIKEMTRRLIDVPIVEIPWQASGNSAEFNREHECSVDLARDLMHSGIKSNQLLAESLHNHILTTGAV